MKERIEDFALTVTNPGVHTILFGDAEPIQYPKSLDISGILSSPGNWLGTGKKVDPNTAHIIVDRDKNYIKLVLDEHSEKSGISVTGNLSHDVDLAAWNINTPKRWTVNELLAFVRERKFFFKEPSVQAKLIASLQKWNVNVETIIKQHNDNSGNSLAMLERKVNDIDLVKEFTLSIPIFKGYEKKDFTVFIGLDPKSSQVDFFLYSDELFFLTRTEREKLFSAELERIKNLNFNCSIIYVS